MAICGVKCRSIEENLAYSSIGGFPCPVCYISCSLPPCFNVTEMLLVLWMHYAISCFSSFPHASSSAWIPIPISFYFTDSCLFHTCVLQQIFLMFQIGPPCPLYYYRTHSMCLLVLTILYHSILNMYSFSSIDYKLF